MLSLLFLVVLPVLWNKVSVVPYQRWSVINCYRSLARVKNSLMLNVLYFRKTQDTSSWVRWLHMLSTFHPPSVVSLYLRRPCLYGFLAAWACILMQLNDLLLIMYDLMILSSLPSHDRLRNKFLPQSMQKESQTSIHKRLILIKMLS